MIRLAILLPVLLAAAPVIAQPAFAQSAGYYVAVPTAQPAKAQLMTRSTPWSLQAGAYVANRAPERDLVLCQLVARDVGALQSFSAGGKPLDGDALAKCNAHAK